MARQLLSVVSLALAALCAFPTLAVEIEPRWQPGGPEGGWVSDIAFARSDPDRAYALVGGMGWPAVGHVFASTDGGVTWGVTGGAAVSQRCEAIAVDPRDADRIYAAFREEGIFRSEDGGWTWSPARDGLPIPHPWMSEYSPVQKIVVSRERPGTVLAAANRRVYLSRDAGDHWFEVPEAGQTTLLTLSPTSPEVAYAGGMRSLDGGSSWEPIPGLQGVAAAVMAFDPTDPARMWAAGHDVHITTDGGESWSAHSAGLDDPWDWLHAVTTDWGDPSRLVAASRYRTHRSTDGGVTWSELPDPLAPLGWTWYESAPLAACPRPGGPILGGSGSLGVMRLDGTAWTPSRSKLHGVSVDILVSDPGRPEVAYAAAGYLLRSVPGLHRTTDGGHTWNEVTAELGPHGVYSLGMDPSDGRHLVVSTGPDGELAASVDAGDTWTPLDLPGHEPGPFSAVLFAPSDPLRAYAFDWWCELYSSTDGGWTWQPVTDEPEACVEPQAAAVDPTDPLTLYAGFGINSGPWDPVHALSRSTDGGVTWEESGSGLPPSPNPCDPLSCPDTVTAIAVDPNHRDRVVAVTRTWGLYVSEDGAASWQASTAPVVAGGVAFVRDRPGTILVGGKDGGGVFISEDAGQTWRPLGAGLDPAPRVLSLAASPDGSLVYAGTSTSVLHLQRSVPPRRPRGRFGAPPP